MNGKDVRIASVRLDQVRFHTHNIRRDLGDLRTLADSIRRFGVMQPIVVENHGDHLRLRAGHRRVAAARLAGLARVPAVIHDDALDDDEWLVHSVQENVMRRGIDDDERRDAITALRELGCTWSGIADTFGVSAATVQNWLKPKEYRNHHEGRRVKASTVRSFAAAWREHADRHTVTVIDLLDALDALAKEGRLADALPSPNALREAS